MDLQTQLLDEFDPPHEDREVAEKRVAEQLFPADGDVLAVFSNVAWYPNASGASVMQADTRRQSGAVVVTQRSVALLWGGLPSDAGAGLGAADVRIPYGDIASIGMKESYAFWFWAVTITQVNGRVDWFGIPSREHPQLMDRSQTQAATEALRSAVRAFGH